MTRDILVKVRGLQKRNGEEEESVEVSTSGKYYLKNGKHYIFFEEVGETVNEVVKNMIIIEDGRAEVTKSGAVESRMAFSNGEKLNTFYVTPFGQMELGIYTESMSFFMDEDSACLKLEYSMDVNNAFVSRNTLELTASSCGC